MEPAKIDWKKIESVFVEDALYENINAPKWVDLLSPDSNPVDDDAWFCRPDCKHPKTAEDFLRSTPIKFPKLASVYDILPLGEKNQRDVIFKRKGVTRSVVPSDKSPTKDTEDSENRNPNISSSTPQKYHTSDLKSFKGGIKLDSEKKKAKDDASQTNAFPKLKSTLSARNLFAGRDLLNQITEFCSELKKLATRGKDKECTDSKLNAKKDVAFSREKPCKVLGEVVGDEKERKPLLEVRKEKSDEVENGRSKVGKQRRIKRFEDAENTPITLNLENVRDKQQERPMQARVSPPTPQCFSAARGAAAGTASKAPKSRLMERQILQEVKLNKEMIKDDNIEKEKEASSVVNGKDAKPLDVFWFLKPCALSS